MSGSASNPGQMAGVACGSYAPHTYLKNKCRDCGHPEAEHPAKPAAADAGAAAANGSAAGADWQSAAAAAGAAPDVAAFEQLSVADAGALNVLKDNKDCAQYKPHAWIYDRCRECGCSESSHLRGADGSKLVDVAPPEASGHRSALGVLRAQSVMNKDGIPIERQVQVSEPGKIDLHAREEALFAAQRSASGSVDKGSNGSIGGHAPHTGGRLDVADIPSGAPPMAMSPTQKRAEQDMQNIVAKMTYFERQKNLVAQADAAKLADKQITQEEFDRREKELQEAFARKEAEVKAEAELARQALEDANEAHRREVEAAAAMQIKEAQEAARKQVEEAQAQTRQLLEDAEREKAAAQEFKRQAEDARAAAQADALLQKQLADAALAEAQQSKSESERQRLEAEERLRAAQEAMASEKEAAAAAAAARELAKDEEQPTGPGGAASVTPTIVAREGDVTLSDVLKNVERLFQQGRNVIRYTGNKPPTFSSIFIRELAPADASPAVGGAPAQVLYSICWSKADERLVDPSRSLDFGDISAVVLGKQSTVLKSQANLPGADDAHCVSFIAGSKCPKRSLHLQLGNERDRDTWAYGIASLMKEFGVKPSVFEPGQYFEHESEKAKDYELNPSYVEEDDGSLPASEKDVHSLATAAREQARYQIELSCKAANLPSVHKNTIVCLVDRNERTNKLEYLNQTERVAGTNTPAFKKKFPLHFVDSAAKTLRFNVYDVPEGSKNIEDECRLGCAIVQIKALVDKPGAEFVYALSHKHPKRQAALTAAQSTLTVSCASRKLISSAVNDSGSGVGSGAGGDDAHKALLTQLRLTEKQLAQGDTFTNHVEGVGEQTITLLYTRGTAGGPPSLSRPTSIASSGAPTTPTSTDAAPAAAAAGGPSTPTPSSATPASDRFELGSLTWSTVGAAPQSVPLRSIVDVFVGKKHRVFPADARDEHCFSLVSRTGVRLDLEAKSKGQRDQWVQGIISFLQAAAAQQQKDRQRAASVSAGGSTPARSTTPSPAAGGAAAAAASPAAAAPPQA